MIEHRHHSAAAADQAKEAMDYCESDDRMCGAVKQEKQRKVTERGACLSSKQRRRWKREKGQKSKWPVLF
jgi:hypothetical protein